MIKLNNIRNIYFIGIGGIGMSSLARYFYSKGAVVEGYDRTRTPLTAQLEHLGMHIHYEDNIELLMKYADVVVYTPAVPGDHSELNFYRENGYTVLKRSDILKIVTEDSYNVCVSGTHGKTTISTMLAHICQDSGLGCNAFLGGIATNYQTNFISSANNLCVIEADEYDRSFLKLFPDVAVITSMDADHLDIYGTAKEMEDAFILFTKNLKNNGCLFVKQGLPRIHDFEAENQFTYSLENSAADIYATHLQVIDGAYRFNIVHPEWSLSNVTLNMGGLHNVENAIVSIAVAKYLGISFEKIKQAVSTFLGVKRRFEMILKTSRHILIDDYAHHPQELHALFTGVHSLYADKKCTVLFQPHLYSRTKDLAEAFAKSLDLVNEVIVLPIYPARELPLEGVTSNLILEKMQLPNKQILDKKEVLHWVEKNDPELLVICGAGDIDMLVNPVKEILLKKENNQVG